MSANGKGAYNRPCSGFMHREGKPEGFFCLDRRTVDSKHDIITDIFATPGNTNDVKPYLGRLRVQIDKFVLDVKYVGLDAGYSILNICKYLYDMGIQAAMGHRRGCQQKGKYGKRVKILTREESKRRNAALPIPKNYMASVIAVCGGFPRLPRSASSLPPCRI